MLIQIVEYAFDPAASSDAACLFRELQVLSRQELGVVRFDVVRDADRPNVFILWEEYCNEIALRAHLDTVHFERIVINGIRLLANARRAKRAAPLSQCSQEIPDLYEDDLPGERGPTPLEREVAVLDFPAQNIRSMRMMKEPLLE